MLTFKASTSAVMCVCFSSDGERIACGEGEYGPTVKVWDGASGQDLRICKGHAQNLTGVCFSPDGKRFASSSADLTVKVWDILTGQNTLTLRGLTSGGIRVAFSADGQRIVAQDMKKDLRSWDAEKGFPIAPCTDPAPGPRTMDLSPDGSWRISIKGKDVHVVKQLDGRPSSDLVPLVRLNDVAARLRWHRAEAAASEATQQWFAAAFHLRQLIFAHEPDAEQLQERLTRCKERLGQM